MVSQQTLDINQEDRCNERHTRSAIQQLRAGRMIVVGKNWAVFAKPSQELTG